MPSPTLLPPVKGDAIFGRGGENNNMRAGSFLRQAIESNWREYSKIPQSNYQAKRGYIKKHFIDPIVQQRGRFLFRKKGQWHEYRPNNAADMREIFKKLSQSLRDEKKRHSLAEGVTPFLEDDDETPDLTPTPLEKFTKPVVTLPGSKSTLVQSEEPRVTAARRVSVHEVSDDSDSDEDTQDGGFATFPELGSFKVMGAKDLIEEFEAEWGVDSEFWSGDNICLDQEVAALMQGGFQTSSAVNTIQQTVQNELASIMSLEHIHDIEVDVQDHEDLFAMESTNVNININVFSV